MNPYLKNLNRLEFVVTNACTGKCKHCSQGDHKTNEQLDKELAADVVRKIAREYNITSVMTFGGEPLLCPDTVCEIHKAAKEMGIAQRQLITNGFFSNNPDKITLVADCLIESGVNEILLSVDAFHQETIPLEPVFAFAKAVQRYHTVQTRVQPAWLVSREDNNIYNIKTREILRQFNDLGIETAVGNVVFPAGNALQYFAEYFDLNTTEQNPYREDPTDIKAICFSANGDILGSNIYQKEISQILADYTPNG